MNVAELVSTLSMLPQDAEVMIHYDGDARSVAAGAWLARGGFVVVGSDWDMVGDDETRIASAPDSAAVPHLYIHEMLGLPPPRDPFDEIMQEDGGQSST